MWAAHCPHRVAERKLARAGNVRSARRRPSPAAPDARPMALGCRSACRLRLSAVMRCPRFSPAARLCCASPMARRGCEMGGRGVACRLQQSHAASRRRGRGCGADRLWRPVSAASPMFLPGVVACGALAVVRLAYGSRGKVAMVVACGAVDGCRGSGRLRRPAALWVGGHLVCGSRGPGRLRRPMGGCGRLWRPVVAASLTAQHAGRLRLHRHRVLTPAQAPWIEPPHAAKVPCSIHGDAILFAVPSFPRSLV
jgi:hypothetical protein